MERLSAVSCAAYRKVVREEPRSVLKTQQRMLGLERNMPTPRGAGGSMRAWLAYLEDATAWSWDLGHGRMV